MKNLKKFGVYNEAKMFDDHLELIQHSDQYLKDIYYDRPASWKKKFSEIINSDASYRSMGYSLISLKEEVEKDRKNLENFKEDVRSHIKEMDEIYQKSGQLSPKDEESYDILERLDDKIGEYLDYIEQYEEDVQGLSDSFISVDDSVRYLSKFDFKIEYFQ